MIGIRGLAVAAGMVTSSALLAQSTGADPSAFRALFKELIETNTTQSAGSCTAAADKIATHLKAAGYRDANLKLFSVPEFPKDGGLVADLPGSDPKAKAILLLAHLDVVEAKREDWTRDPFTLIEEDGKFFGRGTSDDKTQAAIWADLMIRFKQEGFKPRATIKMALTCGEEGGRFNGAKYLVEHHRDWIDAAFALNEGGFITTDEKGEPVSMSVEAGEKTYQDFRLEVTNPGGHSSRPVKDNAIYHLAHALLQVQNYAFPITFIDANRAYFSGMALALANKGDSETAALMTAMTGTPPDLNAAEKVAAKDPSWNSTLRTTCVATLLEAGHAPNALPQRARANVNCRIFPGMAKEKVRAQLAAIINDPAVSVTLEGDFGDTAVAPTLTPQVMGPLTKLVGEMWPGLPVLPILQPYATDGRLLNAAGIPTYGIDGSLVDRSLNNMHGLNEYAGVGSLYRDREFLYRLVKLYSDAG
jgi:acetylornithine deacetylase/succinyl-diaminopimelate desuccinylase-like protein